LYEAIDEEYQAYRHRQVDFCTSAEERRGVPIVEPPGGHAVYVDAKKFLPHIPPEQLPGQALVVQPYVKAGVRAVELGSSCFGKIDEATGKFIPAPWSL
jgi:tryptophanase